MSAVLIFGPLLPQFILWGLAWRVESRLPQWRRDHLRKVNLRYWLIVIAVCLAMVPVTYWATRALEPSPPASSLWTGFLFCIAPIVYIARLKWVARWQPDPPVSLAGD